MQDLISNTLRISIKYLFIAAILQVFIFSARAQNNQNYISLQVTNANFSLNSISSLETVQAITNSFALSTRSRYNYSIYCRVQNISSSTGVNPPASMLAIKCNSGPANANMNTISLSTVDQQIQDGTGGGGGDYFRYNLLLGPVGYSIPPGNYNYTVLFTMTQP